jgi:hypothetical protein
LEKYKGDTIEGTIILKGARYVTTEILDSFDEICDSLPKAWLLPPLTQKHLDKPCEGEWWGQRDALALLPKKTRTKIELLPALRKLDEILKGAAKKKNKRVPLKAYYCEVNGEIVYLLHDEGKDKFYKRLRDPGGRLHKQEETPLREYPIPTAQWGDQHTRTQFPRPKEYSLGEIGAPLDRKTVRQLTLEFSKTDELRQPPLRNGTKRC